MTEDLRPPIDFGPCSNGEYDPRSLPPVVREAVRRAREECLATADRLRLSRRRFLRSLCAASITLLALDACTKEEHRARTGRRSATPGGGYVIPPEAITEPEAAEGALGGDEFIMDVQGHLLEYDLNPVFHGEDFYASFPQQGCGADDPRVCFSIEHFLEAFFIRSDTDVVVLSALPIYPEGSPLSPELMAETRRIVDGLCRDERILLHGQVLPNVGDPHGVLEAMRDTASRYPIRAWKTFTHFPDFFTHDGDAWWLDDHEPELPAVGESFIRASLELADPDDLRPQGAVGRQSVLLAGRHRPGGASASEREPRRLPLRLRDGHVRGSVYVGHRRARRQPADRARSNGRASGRTRTSTPSSARRGGT